MAGHDCALLNFTNAYNCGPLALIAGRRGPRNKIFFGRQVPSSASGPVDEVMTTHDDAGVQRRDWLQKYSVECTLSPHAVPSIHPKSSPSATFRTATLSTIPKKKSR